MDVLRQRVEETVKNLGKHVDATFTKKPMYYVPAKFILPKPEVFQGTLKFGTITHWVHPAWPSHCRFEKRARCKP